MTGWSIRQRKKGQHRFGEDSAERLRQAGEALIDGMRRHLAVAVQRDEEEDEEAIAVGGLTVLTRQDFVVTDYDGLISAGRDAYLRTWPDDRPDDPARQVPDVGGAPYELVHAGGRYAPGDVDQLRPKASITVFHAQETLLSAEQIDFAVEQRRLLLTKPTDYRRPQGPHREGLLRHLL